ATAGAALMAGPASDSATRPPVAASGSATRAASLGLNTGIPLPQDAVPRSEVTADVQKGAGGVVRRSPLHYLDRYPTADHLSREVSNWSPDVRDELAGPLAVGRVTGQVAAEQLFLGGDAALVGPAQQPGHQNQNGHAARG